MAVRRSDDEPRVVSFAELLDTLGEKVRRFERREQRRAEREASAARPAPRPREVAPVVFHRPDPGQPLLGHAGGIDDASFRRLRRGELEPDERLDLHGLTREQARRALHEAVTALWKRGGRCLLLIHGRGRGSEGGPVLKRALPEWLAESPTGRRVLAFAPATRDRGGSGATVVWLRRRR